MRHLQRAGATALVMLWLSVGGTVSGAVLLASAAQAQELVYNQAGLVRGLLPSVVNIIAHANAGEDTASMSAASDQPTQSFRLKSSAGSGFIVDPSGVIVTNWHVVNQAYEIFVTFSDGTRVRADLINAARIIDIALLKVSVDHPLPAIKWGDSGKVQVGDPVLAIGNPLGIGLSVSAGIISALNRNLQDTPYDDFIQTDAAINHGNSGGPLFDLKGEVIGINTALISPTTGSAGLGFAIPSTIADHIVHRLMTFGWVRPAWIGVKVQQVTPEMAEGLGLPEPQGAILAWIMAGSPAAAAGLRIGDIVTSINDVTPTDERDLLRRIASSTPGEVVKLRVLRDLHPLDVTITLAEWPRMQWEERDGPTKVTAPHWTVPADLGVQVAEITEKLRAENDIATGPAGTKAVFVTGVTPDTDAARRGMAPGDLVLQVGNTPVATSSEMQREIDRVRTDKRTFAMLLVLPKEAAASKWVAPKWVPLRAVAD